jgi:uncharacterized protein YecT (DUF1311 family)
LLASTTAPARGLAPAVAQCEAFIPNASRVACLREVRAEAERKLSEALDGWIAKTSARDDLNAARKARFERIARETHNAWLRLRNTECQELAPLVAEAQASLFEDRLKCLIAADVQRTRDLWQRAGD